MKENQVAIINNMIAMLRSVSWPFPVHETLFGAVNKLEEARSEIEEFNPGYYEASDGSHVERTYGSECGVLAAPVLDDQGPVHETPSEPYIRTFHVPARKSPYGEVIPIDHIEVWTEGYAVTGDSSRARFLGHFRADTLLEAFRMWVERDHESRRSYADFESDPPTFWSCRVYDNEASARASFG